MRVRHPAVSLCAAVFAVAAVPAAAQNLEIHYINVGWGSSVFVKGPNGTTVLLEAGNTGKGTSKVVPYLQSIGVPPSAGLDYTIAGHQHCDHIGGLDEVVNAGYDVRFANYYNGSSYSSSCVTGWNGAAAGTSAGSPVSVPVGTQIPLGSGAVLTVVASRAHVIGGGSVSASNENDLSIAVLIQYGGFDYLWASDLGGGNVDTSCTGRSTTQVDVETAVVQAISPGGAFPLITAGGIDVLNVNHHGSESSTNKNWFNYSAPAVALVATGAGQSQSWDLPRIDVVEHVLRAEATACITAPPALVLQTEEGSPTGSLTSFRGYCVGNIKVTTGGSTFTVSADGAVTQGPNEVGAAGLPRTYAVDGGGGGTPTPTPTPTRTPTPTPTRTPTPTPTPVSLTIGGWQVVQANSAQTYTIPAGTTIAANGYVVIGRNASKAQFQSFWGTLPANAVYLNSGDVLPLINGSENYTLKNAGGTTIDGPTISQPSAALKSIKRVDPCLPAGQASSWTVLDAATGNPGSGAAAGCAAGVRINEFSDANGSGNFIYEFVELHFDQ